MTRRERSSQARARSAWGRFHLVTSSPGDPLRLPLASARPERADAARNRRRVLAAAQRLFADHGPAGVSLEAVAREAGVGKATLFRRFPDRHALIAALLDEHERELQDALLAGPPPLGPGAPPLERALAFLDRLLDVSLAHLELLLASETAKPLARPHAGTGLLAHQLLAPFDAELLRRQLDEGADQPALQAALRDLTRRALAP